MVRLKLRSAGVAVAVAGLVVAATPDAATAATSKTRADGMTVVATGLDNPRGLAVTPAGVVLVAEAGRGGQAPCLVGGQDQVFCLGATGAITAIRGHQQKRVAAGLPSLGTPTQSEVLGPHDIALTQPGRWSPSALARTRSAGPSWVPPGRSSARPCGSGRRARARSPIWRAGRW